MTHKMHLYPSPYEKIKSRMKTIELRLLKYGVVGIEIELMQENEVKS